ncbi:hypothetical protein EX895_001029 [Sporisorium graminicola]|uniref:Uncharacterized protein n=1 Tax=Sporisorium graminicola TaxID=280036 RepID=A0A4U7L2J8_9BASI|nr:hypothetical protein EX895_001029 [Sporisorium graminicola]TKY91030.1 hypothetical protein EX895_001029 [Sporisorium graminicola]
MILVSIFVLQLLLAYCCLADAVDQPIAVCTLPQHVDLITLANAARGIHFEDCPPDHRGTPPSPPGLKLARVSVAANSGLQAQFFDLGFFDDYWLKGYLSPKLPGFRVECWQAPAQGCTAGEPEAAALPRPAVKKLILVNGVSVAAPLRRERHVRYSGADDAELLSLDDPSLHTR